MQVVRVFEQGLRRLGVVAGTSVIPSVDAETAMVNGRCRDSDGRCRDAETVMVDGRCRDQDRDSCATAMVDSETRTSVLVVVGAETPSIFGAETGAPLIVQRQGLLRFSVQRQGIPSIVGAETGALAMLVPE